MKLSLGCDHGAYALKEHLKDYLTGQGHEVVDCGTYSTDSCDYPIFARAAAEQVASGQCERGPRRLRRPFGPRLVKLR